MVFRKFATPPAKGKIRSPINVMRAGKIPSEYCGINSETRNGTKKYAITIKGKVAVNADKDCVAIIGNREKVEPVSP